jgi:hypothetical protein
MGEEVGKMQFRVQGGKINKNVCIKKGEKREKRKKENMCMRKNMSMHIIYIYRAILKCT